MLQHLPTQIIRLSNRIIGYLFHHSLRYFIGLFTLLLATLALLLPSAYVVEEPGLTQNVLGTLQHKPVIQIRNIPHYQHRGKLLMTTVSVSGVPGYEIPTVAAMFQSIQTHRVLNPREAIVPIGQGAPDYTKQATDEMNGAQAHAVSAALKVARKLGIAADKRNIKLFGGDIGGPSAGMMYALGIISLLTSYDETGCATIAGTGTIDAQGKIGAIGGIRLKMVSAQRDGASWFIAPEANRQELLGYVPQGLRVVTVQTIDEAYRILQIISSGHAEQQLQHKLVR